MYHHQNRRRVENADNPNNDDERCSVFTSSVEAHPYGVLPGGNRFLYQASKHDVVQQQKNHDQSSSSSQSIFQNLDNDVLWQDILSFCDGSTLCRVIQTCRRFYVLGHSPELWRDLTLRLQCDLDQMGPSWKDTYVMMMTNAKHPNQKTHVPRQVTGVYSDYLFRTHMCRSFSIPSHWMQVDPVHTEIIHHKVPYGSKIPRLKNLSTQDFLHHFEQPNCPVVIAGVAKSWPAAQKWINMEYFRQCEEQRKSGNDCRDSKDFCRRQPLTTLRATSGAAPLSAQFTIPAYLSYCRWDYLEEAPLYLFDRNALIPQHPPHHHCQEDDLATVLQNDYLPSLRSTLPFWDPDKCTDNGGHDLFQYLGEGKRPDHTWLIVGPRRSGSVFHIDPNATHAWNANIVGRKRWIFYPPGMAPPGVYPSDDGDQVTLPLSIGEWLIGYYETEHVAASCTSTSCLQPMEITVEAGDVVFVPHGWWHMVVNLDDLNIAITHNYVSRSNLPNVLRFLRTQQDQISGCRDRPDSIQPENLYPSFVQVLQQHHPDWLSEALAVSDWTCNAWKSLTTFDEKIKYRSKRQKHQHIDSTVTTTKKQRFVQNVDTTNNGNKQMAEIDENGRNGMKTVFEVNSGSPSEFRFSFL